MADKAEVLLSAQFYSGKIKYFHLKNKLWILGILISGLVSKVIYKVESFQNELINSEKQKRQHGKHANTISVDIDY